MILPVYLKEWRQHAPWANDAMVEQDLILSRALVELFNHPKVVGTLAFRGGTALYKLYIQPALRYSEDIDLVQMTAAPIGELLDVIKSILDPLLGQPRRNFKEGRVTIIYRLALANQIPGRLKIEINTREHFSVDGFCKKPFKVASRWFSGETQIPTFSLNELIATKIRALYQRKKGRDLFDLWVALQQPDYQPEKSMEAFKIYMRHDGHHVTRAMFELNLAEKLDSSVFCEDINPLLTSDMHWHLPTAAQAVKKSIITLLPGEPWQGNKS